ncbi:LANO_0G14180g1_1 [Lachancea nothofagi CBS 11611]|uniref:LANO_0G14180g1_1 n=1 Tax=Lachancea nothofagi CBS 11611 TaxID=1266666 RepID=A0A1G4KK55_9SACH|nr:LANO_0G14180g1_1 [Lachancea nothofagi CBS 11611]
MESLNVPPAVVDWLFKVTQPYYDGRTTFRDVLYTLSEFRNLRPRTKTYTDFQGKPQLLLCLYGQIESVKISIPVLIWIPIEYPILAPYAYLDLAALKDKEVKVSGEAVDPNGVFFLPIISRWSPESCNLRDLVYELSYVVMQNPPLMVEITSTRSPPLPERLKLEAPALPPKNLSEVIDEEASDVSNTNLEAPAPAPAPAPALPPKPPHFEQRQPSFVSEAAPEDPSPTIFQRQGSPKPVAQPNLMDMDAESSQNSSYTGALETLRSVVVLLTEQDHKEVQETLRTRMYAIQNATTQFRSICDHERALVEQKEQALRKRHDSLTSGLDQINAQLNKAQQYVQDHGPEVDLQSMLAPDAAGVQQLRQLVARDHAITDTVHALSRMLGQSTISLDMFMRKVRTLGRDQFLIRAHMNKIVEKARM